MKTMMTRLLTAAFLCVLPATAHAATLVVNGGILTGAKNVLVEGKNYDVAFAEGTCATVYGKCDTKNFDFTTESSAIAAAQALLDQVFIDSADGNFDSRPAAVMGCTNATICTTLIRFAAHGIVAWNNVAEARNSASSADIALGANSYGTTDTSMSASTNFARFTAVTTTSATPVSAVPEPATWALMLAGFGLTGAAIRRRRVRFTRVVA
jgi:hypothetical protein